MFGFGEDPAPGSGFAVQVYVGDRVVATYDPFTGEQTPSEEGSPGFGSLVLTFLRLFKVGIGAETPAGKVGPWPV